MAGKAGATFEIIAECRFCGAVWEAKEYLFDPPKDILPRPHTLCVQRAQAEERELGWVAGRWSACPVEITGCGVRAVRATHGQFSWVALEVEDSASLTELHLARGMGLSVEDTRTRRWKFEESRNQRMPACLFPAWFIAEKAGL